MSEAWLVITYAPDVEVARMIAAALVKSKQAACVNIVSPCESVYRWKGAVETASEVPLWIKTTAERYAEVEATIRALHPHSGPEIIDIPIYSSLPAYIDWIRAETTPPRLPWDHAPALGGYSAGRERKRLTPIRRSPAP